MDPAETEMKVISCHLLDKKRTCHGRIWIPGKRPVVCLGVLACEADGGQALVELGTGAAETGHGQDHSSGLVSLQQKDPVVGFVDFLWSFSVCSFIESLFILTVFFLCLAWPHVALFLGF